MGNNKDNKSLYEIYRSRTNNGDMGVGKIVGTISCFN